MVPLPRELRVSLPPRHQGLKRRFGLRVRPIDGAGICPGPHSRMEASMSSTIQARFGEDAYPIGRLVLNRAQALGVSRTELVRRLGYQKPNNGHRALAGLL